MADELTLRASLSCTKDGTTTALAVGPLLLDVTGGQALKNRQTVGTSEEALVVGDVASGGYMLAVNRDPTNFVQILGASGETPLVRLEPGDLCLFRVDDGATLYAIANTAPCDVEYAILDA
ncbi:MAG: hypothetical protein KDD82_09305 [Planctomycetes bacterium]|nr:hypothetical protein [Planctomycetota bacterium]